MVDSTLALLAAIKENRAGLLRTETSRSESTRIQTLHEETLRAESLRVEAAKRPPVPVISTPRAAPVPDAFFTAATRISPLESALDKVPGGPRTVLIVGALIAVGGISTGLLMRSHRTHKSAAIVSTAPAPIPAPNANFPLRLELAGPGLAGPGKGPVEVRWNPKSTLIAQARSGRLVVTEANQPPRTIPLSLSQLEVGHLTYQQQTERAQLRLEVVDASGSVAEESAMSGTPGATPPTTTAANAPTTAATATATAAPATAAAAPTIATPGTPAAPAAPAASRPEPRAFTPPAVNRAGQPNSIVDAPPAVDASPAAPISLIYAPVPRVTLPPPPAPAVPALTPANPRIRVDGNLQAAKLVKQVAPVYPPLAKTARVQGAVRFQAIIGKDGVIRNLDVIGGPPLLQPAAIDAVRQWTYRPTLLNGQAVEVSTTIEVLFTLGQ
jgi:TonB family protein